MSRPRAEQRVEADKHDLWLTLGRGKANPEGTRHAVSDATDVVLKLQGHNGLDAWWSPSAYKNDYRNKVNWESACAVAIDIDYYDSKDRHTTPPRESREAFDRVAAQSGATFLHHTPRGARLVWVLIRQCTDLDRWLMAARAVCKHLDLAIKGSGYRIDRGASLDRARFLWAPQTSVAGSARTDEIKILGQPVDLESLAQEPPDVVASSEAIPTSSLLVESTSPVGVSPEQSRAISALHAIPPSAKRPEWLAAIFAFHAAVGGAPWGARVVEEWSSRSDHVTGTLEGKFPISQYKEGEATEIYQKARLPDPAEVFDEDAPPRTGPGTLFWMAKAHGWSEHANAPVGGQRSQQRQSTQPCSPLDVVRRWQREGPVVHEPTGIPTFDAMTRGGLVHGTVAVIIGAPDASKTLLMLDLADKFASRGVVIGIQAVDEDEDGLTMRLLQRRGISRDRCESRTPDSFAGMKQQLADVDPLIRFYDPTWTIEQAANDLGAYARQLEKRCALFADSLQTVRCDAEASVSSLREQVSLRMFALKEAARNQRMLALTTSEMARVGYRSRKDEDEVNDLALGKESGSIEYQAKVVISVRSEGDPNRPDLIRLKLVKNKIGTAHNAHDKNAGIRLRIDRAAQNLIEDEGYEAPRIDGTRRDQHELAKERQELQVLAAEVACVIANKPGLGTVRLRAEARARLTKIGNDRLNTCLAMLKGGVVIVRGRKTKEQHYLDGSKVPEEILLHVPDAELQTVKEARPPC